MQYFYILFDLKTYAGAKKIGKIFQNLICYLSPVKTVGIITSVRAYHLSSAYLILFGIFSVGTKVRRGYQITVQNQVIN